MCDECGGTCGATGRRAGLRRAARGSDPVAGVMPSRVDDMHEALEPIHRALRSINAVPLLGARPVLVAGSLTGVATTSTLSGSAGRLAGLSIAETTGTTGAAIRLRDSGDGAPTDGDPILRINLAPNESVREWFLPHGIGYGYGLVFEVLSGSVEATVYLGRDW